MDRRVQSTWLLLKIVFGVVPIVAGLDKFVGFLADWQAYLSPLARSLLPVSPGLFMKVVGVIEIVAGIIVLSRYTRIGAYIVAIWLVAIALELVTGRHLDIAVRDLVMAVSAFSLARLTEARDAVAARTPARAPVPPPGAAPARA
ncbi:DoxX family membrane protein [Anaeromyxobacter oryzae]|uniref:tRNA (5-methylaminomethyl-2-thiouridylate)-methyltransferase n=1 Tax=Anaeromyxobacter oryzae TaxID=2918170 RepID=A0ABM7X0L9_9BACT|nr:DoxX family membrane protein [Anaeromyxobacter oryzae]BDG05278.1 hypothetical protein AMOR_42740 [Anaeromyxobacter oryzae]